MRKNKIEIAAGKSEGRARGRRKLNPNQDSLASKRRRGIQEDSTGTDGDVREANVAFMPSHFQNKSLTYSATEQNTYILWLVNMLLSGESIDAVIELKQSEHNQNRLSGRLMNENSEELLPNDYVATSIRQESTEQLGTEKEFEVELL